MTNNIALDSTCCELTLDGQSAPLTGDYTLLFRQRPDGPPEPVLYFRGLRVIRAWSLNLSHTAPADRFGISGGQDAVPATGHYGKVVAGGKGTNS